jgi:hypothetical protein
MVGISMQSFIIKKAFPRNRKGLYSASFFKLNAVAAVLLHFQDTSIVANSLQNAAPFENIPLAELELAFSAANLPLYKQDIEQTLKKETTLINEQNIEQNDPLKTLADNKPNTETIEDNTNILQPNTAPNEPVDILLADTDVIELEETAIQQTSLSKETDSFSFGGDPLSTTQIEAVDGSSQGRQQEIDGDLNFEEPNTAPTLETIENMTHNESELFSFTATATDTNTPPNALEFSISSEPFPLSGAAITSGGVFSWVPPSSLNDTGIAYTFEITVTETNGNPSNLSDSQSFIVYANKVDLTVPNNNDNCSASYFHRITGTNVAEPIIRDPSLRFNLRKKW